MQLEHWQLAESPFRAGQNTDQFYPSAGHDEALARLEFLVDARRRLGVLLGDAGVGKSLVLHVAAKKLARGGAAVVVVDALGMGTREFLWQLAAGLGAAPREDSDAVRLWRLIADRVVENRLQNVNTVLLVDEAGQAGHDVLTQFIRLARLDLSPAARWTFVLASERGQAARWNETLRDLVDLRIDLEPWNQDDTIGYVQTALVDAGRFDPVFDDDALRALYELSGGVPRRVARLAEFALLAGAAAEMELIDETTVNSAYDELRWPKPEPATY